MADKTLVLKVDLDCQKCYNKVRRALCQNHYEIRSQSIDRKQNTITISGPFDASSLAKKLNSKAGSAIKGIEVKEPPKQVVEKPKSDAKPKSDEKPKEVKKDDKPKSDEKPKEVKKDDKPKSDAKPEAKKSDAKPADKPKEAAGGDKAKSDPPKEAAPVAKAAATGPVVAYPIIQPPYGVYSMPSYQGYAEMVPVHYDYGRPVGSYDGYDGNYAANYNANYHGNYAGNHYYGENKPNVYGTDYFSDKDPSCSIM